MHYLIHQLFQNFCSFDANAYMSNDPRWKTTGGEGGEKISKRGMKLQNKFNI